MIGIIPQGSQAGTPAKENEDASFRFSPLLITGQKVSMVDLAALLTRQLKQLVIDKTELEGEFDFEVGYSWDGRSGPGR